MALHRVYFNKGAQALTTIPHTAGSPVRVLTPARAARPAMSSGSARCISAQVKAQSTGSGPAAAGSGRSMNWAWPPSR